MNDLSGIGKLSEETKEIFMAVYPDLLQPSFKKVGYALSHTIGFLSIPFTYLDNQTKKANLYFERNLEKYKDKLNEYEASKIGTVAPEIGQPILEKFFIVTSEELSNMFSNLLVSASLIEKSKYAHPSFINVLQNISVDEAKIINYLTQENDPLLFYSYIKEDKETSSFEKMKDIYINLQGNIKLTHPEMAEFYFLNLEKLGIIESMPGFPHKLTHAEESVSLEFDRSVYDVDEVEAHIVLTSYGDEFIKSIKD